MSNNESIEGLDLILRKLTALETKASGRVLATIIRAQLNVIGKQMKADTDSKVKEARKGVGSRFKNKKKKNEITAKVGFRVGKKKKVKVTASVMYRGNIAQQRKRGGVGISAQNVHWWVAGTQPRYAGISYRKKEITGSPIHSTGSMPSMQPGLAAIAATKSRGKQNAEMIKRGALALQKEVLKIQNMR